MTSRTVAASLLAVGCLTAAAAGSYVAVRQNAAAATTAPVAAPAPATTPETPAVNETEGVVAPSEAPRAEPVTPPVEVERPREARPPARKVFPRQAPARRTAPARVSAEPEQAAPSPAPATEPAVAENRPFTPGPVSTSGLPSAAVPPVETVPAERPVEPELQRIVLPASSVIGLEIETTISSEKAEVEDRVNARVTRDVYADGRLAIPAGSRVLGNVTLVERGGKVKERARLGVRFHTLVIADGRQVPLRTETIYRDGESPANDSSRKIGGAAVDGAVLGAILGGGKGAIAGATVGAGAGTAAVMAGGRKPATLTSGSVVTVKLASPVTFEVER